MIVVIGLGEDGRGARVLARITRLSAETLGLAPGAAVHAQIKAAALARHGSRRGVRHGVRSAGD